MFKGKREKAVRRGLGFRRDRTRDRPEADAIRDDGLLMAVKPAWGYRFHSDHFNVDDRVACILEFAANQGVTDGLGFFWGLARIPRGLEQGVSVTVLDSVERMPESWVTDALSRAEGLGNMDAGAQAEAGTVTSRHRASVRQRQLAQIAVEVNNGASYLQDKMRMIVCAPDLETLDRACERLNRYYTEAFSGVYLGSYMGCQRSELQGLLSWNKDKMGRGHHFTSTEFAGSYPLVTHGLEDPAGEYVGYMMGDVNDSAVLCDIDRFGRNVVVCSDTREAQRYGAPVYAVWSAAMVHACLSNGHRVVHLKLDSIDDSGLHPEGLSETRIDMNRGDVNMFEVFGAPGTDRASFAAHRQKVCLMADLAYSDKADESSVIIREQLGKMLNKFYIHRGMWADRGGKVRVLGVAHDQAPLLREFISYITDAYESEKESRGIDPELLSALNQIRLTFTNLAQYNGDLFDTPTSDAIDSVRQASRVVYDFSSLLTRGRGVALAQFVNVVSYAIQSLGSGDLCIVTGAERLSPPVWEYLDTCLGSLHERGGRTALAYGSFDAMFDSYKENRFHAADYTVFGTMTKEEAGRYQKIVDGQVPKDLADLVTSRSPDLAYLHRDFENVVFKLDVPVRP